MKKCTLCGKEFDMWDEQENFGFHYYIGYGSKFDTQKIDVNMCTDCFDKMLEEYILPKCKENPLEEYM